ncbi:MoaD/ThiS family protein [Altericroceibacterium endophyticum]|uniref:MoaD/ThiS family protein n=1 Tax=Altericroceibacterium endophyticum TaxID=1808508 RepID=A0A6I4TAW7_9SPHN|nr:MoaD/ThiS family protein [Altericroceibacterium endophyticum]MXO66905.1 MoaD/ThiS family protein [Altericroceibacterium endophyticum]
MSVTVVFLGRLADLAGAEQMMEAPLDWAGLLAGLPEDARVAIGDARVKLAHNGNLLSDREALQAQNGDEVALLPPVSGG